ncbi:MAG: MFS transporter [Deltaproteobacteria bacterium]|nr:MAG: MFS transporter [Deltaproteobacteria bacterium]
MSVAHPKSLALALAPGTLLAGIAGGIAFPILPILGREVGLSLPFIGVILAANRAMRVVSAPYVGVLADRIGFRRTLLVGLALQVVVMGIFLLAVVTHAEGPLFLLGRLVHGPASACVFISAQALALAGGPGNTGQTAGAVRATIVLGIPLGLFLGGLLADGVGYAWTFAVAALAGAVALAAALVTVPDVRPVGPSPGSVLEAVRALKDRRLLGVGSLSFALAFSMSGVVLSTLALLVASRDLSVFGRDVQATAGLLMGLMVLVDATLTPFAGRLGDRRGNHAQVAAAGLVLLAVGLVVVSVAPATTLTALGIVIVGVGAAFLGPSVLVLLGAVVPADRRGAGAGILQLCGDVGGMLGPVVGTTLFALGVPVPYLLAAAVVVLFVPVALWLARAVRG